MSLSYVAAEYFVEALGRSLNFSISCENLIALTKEVNNKEIVSYLEKKSKNDLFYIIKKFPDVFVFSRNSVTLTDAFLSLYAFPNSANFSTNIKCKNIYENAAVEYFKLLLSRCGTFHYFVLFNILYNENTELSAYYSLYTTTDMYLFFKTHSDIFSIVGESIYLNKQSFNIKFPALSEDASAKSLNKLAKSVYFLLSCFESLHYIELKQCISFVINSVRMFLNQYTLIMQRELFENLPETTMDKNGYLTLKNFKASMPKSRKKKLVILIVCILAFQREMHFLKVVQEVKQRSSSKINSSLCSLSIAEQFRFFKDLEFFVIYDDGYVSLLPSFVLPICNFEDSSACLNSVTFQNVSKSLFSYSALDNFKSNISLQTHKNVVESQISYSASSNIQSNMSLQIESSVRTESQNIQSNILNSQPATTKPSINIPVIDLTNSDSDSELVTESCDILNSQIMFCILYLLRCIDSPVCINIVKTVLHVLHDVRVEFFNSMSTAKRDFIKECCLFFDSESNKSITKDISSMFDSVKNVKIPLFIIYILIEHGKMHFEKLVKLLIAKKVDRELSAMSISCQFKYFREMDEYLSIGSDGFVSLNEVFNPIKSIVDSYSDLFPNTQTKKDQRMYVIPQKRQISDNSVKKKTSPYKVFSSPLFNAADKVSNLRKCSSISIPQSSNSNFANNGKNTKLQDLSSISTESKFTVLEDLSSELPETKFTLLQDASGIATESKFNGHNSLDGTNIFNKHVRNSVLYLLKSVDSPNCKDVIKTVLLVFKDLQVAFSDPSTDKLSFLKECCLCYKELRDNLTNSFSYVCDVKKEEKLLLFITYLLVEKNKIHFQKLATILIEKNIESSLSVMNASDLFKYFAKMNGNVAFIMCCSGYLTMVNDPFHSINITINSYSDFISKIYKYDKQVQSTNKCNISQDKQVCVKPLENQITTNYLNKDSSIAANEVKPSMVISQNANVVSKSSNYFSYMEIEVSTDVFNRVKHSIVYLRNYFDPVISKNVLETFMHALTDVRICFCNLCSTDQHKFVEKCFQFITDESRDVLAADLNSSAKDLNEDEKNVLAVAYLLLKDSTMHFQKIVKLLNHHKVECSLLFFNLSDQFKYFKTLSRFLTINGEGYVCLNNSFYYLSAVINLAVTSLPVIQKNDENKSVSSKYPLVDTDNNSTYSKTTDEVFSENENDMNSSKCISLNTDTNDVTNLITDVCYSLLSVCKEMQIEKLCNRLKSCKMKNIQNFFSFYTISEKLNFFRNMSQYFDVTKDGFVSLKKSAITSYVPKTNVNPVEIFIKDNSLSECAVNGMHSNRPASVASSDMSETNYSPYSFYERKKKRAKRGLCSRKNQLTTHSKTSSASSGNSEKMAKSLSKAKSNVGALKEMQNVSSFSRINVSMDLTSSSSLSNNSVRDKDTLISSSDSSTKMKSKNFQNSSSKPNSDTDINFGSTPEGISKSNIQLQIPRQPLEVRNSKKIISNVSTDPSLNASVEGKKINSNLEFQSKSASVLKNLSSNQLSKEYPQKLIGSTEIFSVNSESTPCSSKDHAITKNENISYGTELVNSLLGELQLDTSPSNKESMHEASFQNELSMPKLENNIRDKSKSLSKISEAQNVTNIQKSCDHNELPIPKISKCHSVQDLLNSNSSNIFCTSEDVVKELQAVNFFCVMLGKYDIGVSAHFLKKHLALASSEVQSFMLCYFKKDILPFFLKHEKVFYVSPQSQNVYLIKNIHV